MINEMTGITNLTLKAVCSQNISVKELKNYPNLDQKKLQILMKRLKQKV